MKTKNFLFLLVLVSCLFCCKNNEAEKADLERADSLSIKLNSPELKAVNKELLENPNSADLYVKRGRVYLSLHELEEAINDANRAIKIDSTKADYFMLLVDAYFSQNKTRQAKDELEKIEKKFPDNTEALMKLGELFYIVRQYQKGIDYINKALKIDEHIAKGYFLKGKIYSESGDTNRAISSLVTATEQDNAYEDAFYDLGIMYAARKNPLALEYYQSALRINPNNNEAKYARAKFLQDIGKIDEAVKEYEALISENKTCENCYYNLGAIYLNLKQDNKKALDYFTKAIELNPSYIQAYFARGYTYSKLKDKENAKADYKMCLKIEPNYEAAIEGLNEL
ncbi:MAG: tetratricopeptide repeat protein [Bacteroidetes bacterium]|nr:tetratricopeptide repeat protein [Bacteroidota bacterium]